QRRAANDAAREAKGGARMMTMLRRFAVRALLALAPAVALAGCSAVSSLMRPEGNGGWDQAQRQAEVARIAAAAGVTYPAEPGVQPGAPTTSPTTLDLPAAVHMATSGNRRIADARERVTAAEYQFDETRGRFFPATTASGVFTRYSSDQTTQV